MLRAGMLCFEGVGGVFLELNLPLDRRVNHTRT